MLRNSVKRLMCLVCVSGLLGGCTAARPDAAELNRAAIAGNVQEVTALLDKGTDVDGLDADGRTALMNACSSGRPRMASLLIVRGAAVNKQVNGNETPLLCGQNFPEVVRVLRHAGAVR